MDREIAANLRKSYSALLEQIEEQAKALKEEDIERYLAISDKRDSEMERVRLLVGHPALNIESSFASGLPSDDVAELKKLLSTTVELDGQNGLALARLMAGARGEMDNMRENRAMLLGYARTLGRNESLAFDEKI